MTTPRKGLSKSKIVSGLQCPKRLYLEINQPELADNSGAQMAFAIGNAFGELARTLYPGGQLIGHDDALDTALVETQEAMADDSVPVLFEATYVHDDVLIRADVVRKHGPGVILTEVKASTSVKDYHLTDAAVQTWVIEQNGYPVERIHIGHVNRDFVYPGNDDYQGILTEVDVTEAVRERVPRVNDSVQSLRDMLSGDEPDIVPGPQCRSPYTCPFLAHCDPPTCVYPVNTLPGKGRIVQDLRDEGIEDIRDIPEGRLTNPTQEKVRRITVSGKEEIHPAATETVRALGYPRYYLDFETSGFVIPRWAGLRPFEMVPFQWSCHIEHEDGRVDHAEFLDTTGEFPVRRFAESLIDALGADGPVLMYTSYERTVINGLLPLVPDLYAPLQNILDRLVDLHPVVKQHYYHPDMHGSWSIKAVLPAMVPKLDYKSLEGVADGLAAANAYVEMLDDQTPDARKRDIADQLLKYCKLDTLAMVEVVKKLSQAYST